MPTWSFAALRGLKRERSPDPGQELANAPPKRQEVETNAVASEPAEFPWTTCDDKGDVERLAIKEDALKMAEKGCAQVRKALESTITQVERERTVEGLVMGGQLMIKQWLEDHGKCLSSFVGVEGPTGAGKSSFLDSLLGVQELFPSGHQGAATAVIGKVSWNWDDAPGHLFRAKVTFLKKSDIENTLESLLEDIKSILDFEGTVNDDDAEATEERDTINSRITYEMAKVKAVFRIDRDELMAAVKEKGSVQSYKPLVQWLLNRNLRAHQFLRQGFIQFKSSTLDGLRSDIKPFLTSRSSKFGSDRAFAIWPLVEDVHLFVKSEILKSGMTLVDLPGCGDSTACRSEIARKFSHRLDVRLVVSPIVRAADEKQGQALMQSGFDEAQMKIRGKYNGHGFGVVLSKTDQLPVHRYLEEFLQDHNDPETRTKLEEFRTLEMKNTKLGKKIRDLIRLVQKAKQDEKKARDAYLQATKDLPDQSQGNAEFGQAHMKKLQGRVNHFQEVLDKGSRMLESSRAQAQEASQAQYDVDDWLHVKAISERNSVVKEQIQANYAVRQKELNRGGEVSHALPMFLVSSDAFWHWKKTTSPCKGYPSIEATGVPAAEKWLLEATLRKRERHLDGVLGNYHNLMNLMRIYSQEKGRDADFGITRSSVEDALVPIHQNVAADLSLRLSAASTAMDHLDPLANREMATQKFTADATDVAKNWSRKYPDDERSGKMASGAYGANMKRGGEPYTSKCNDGPITYCWNEGLTTPYLRFISRDFDEDMNQKMRQIENQAVGAFKHGWQHYPKKIENVIREKFPTLELSFNNLVLMMANVERMSTTKIRNVFEKLSSNASQITEDATCYIGGQMKPVFDAGLEIVGQGSYVKRIAHNVSGVRRRGPTMGAGVQDDSETMLKERMNNAKIELNQVAREAIQSVKQQVSLLIDNLMDNCPADNALKVKKLELQRQIRVHLGEWEQAWQQQETGHEVSNSGPNAPQLEAVKGVDEIGDSCDDSEDNLDDPFEIFEDDSME
ncbi:hypothetical protein FGRMN_6317 [Fusarium graminum]|nr:hypothetical protein FGRMN_6317 [Fusarium graminum]